MVFPHVDADSSANIASKCYYQICCLEEFVFLKSKGQPYFFFNFLLLPNLMYLGFRKTFLLNKIIANLKKLFPTLLSL